MASSSIDDTVRLWDTASGRQARLLTGHTDEVEEVVFSPDGRLLASGSWDLTVRLWDVASGAEIVQLTGPTGWDLAGGRAESGTEAVRVWRLEVR